MNTQSKPVSLLEQAAQIPQLERGKLSSLREGPAGPYYNHQYRKDGKHVSRYVPRDQVPALQGAIDGFQQFTQLVEQYVDQVVDQTRRQIAGDSKKNPPPRRRRTTALPKTPRSRKSSTTSVPKPPAG